jgi:hypothetical protein
MRFMTSCTAGMHIPSRFGGRLEDKMPDEIFCQSLHRANQAEDWLPGKG